MTVTALAEPEGRDSAKAADAKHVRAAATRSARVWIRVIQAQIHNRMGEEAAASGALQDAQECL